MQQKKRLTTPPSTRTCCWRSALAHRNHGSPTIPVRCRVASEATISHATREALSAGAGMQSALSRPGCNLGTPPPRAGRRANAARVPATPDEHRSPRARKWPKNARARRFGCAVARLGAPGADRRAATDQRDCQGRPHGDALSAARRRSRARRRSWRRPGGHRGRGPHLLLRGSGMGIKVIDD